MAWTSLPVKKETKQKIADLSEKDGRDWDTFLRRQLLSENIDGDSAYSDNLPSTTIFKDSEPIPEIETAVSETNSTTLVDPETGERFETGEWLTYEIIEQDHPVSGETEYYHSVDYSDVPAEYNGHTFPDRMLIHLQKELQLRNYFVLGLDFEHELFEVQHTDLIRRRLEKSVL